MLQVIQGSAAVNRLVGLLKSRYGLELRIRSMQAVNSDNLLDQGMQVLRGDLHIPITSNNHYFATAQIVGGEKLTAKDQTNINDLVQAVLEPEFYNWYLSQLAENSIHADQATNNPTIVSIFNHDETKAVSPLTSSIYLYSTDSKKLMQVSHELHNLSDRWAYLQYSELSEQLRNADDIKSLGSLTLQMGTIEKLNTKDQDIILSFLNSANYSEHPLMITTGSESLNTLVVKKIISEELATELSKNSLNVDRVSLDLDLLQETLEFML